MRVKKIRIDQVLGIEHLEIEPGKVTVISGANAAGKTSVLEALKAAFGGGHDATLLRAGAKEGEIVLVLEDDRGDYLVRKSITGETSKLRVRHAEREVGEVSRPQNFLNRLLPGENFDLVSFIEASPKDLLRLVLEALPVRVPKEALEPLVERHGRLLGEAALKAADGEHAFEVLDLARKALYDERTALNRVAKEHAATAAQLTEALPPEDGIDWQAELQRRTAALTEATRALELARAGVRAENMQGAAEAQRDGEEALVQARKRLDGLGRDFAQKFSEAGAEALAEEKELGRLCSARLEELRLAYERDVAETRRAFSERQQMATDKYRQKSCELREAYEPLQREAMANIQELRDAIRMAQEAALKALPAALSSVDARHEDLLSGALTAGVAEAQAKAAEAARTAKTRELRDRSLVEARRHEAQAEALTAALVELAEVGERLLSDLPIPGLRVRDGALFLRDVPVERLSGAQRIELGLEIALRLAGELKLIIVDGLERLDPERFRHFCELAEKSDAQLIGTRVTEGALRLETGRT